MERISVIPLVVGLGVAVALAALLTHPRVRALEQKLGVSMMIASGLPFLGMGALFSRPDVGILGPQVLHDLAPAFHFGLGWIGFVVGMQFDVRRLERQHRHVGAMVFVETVLPLVLTAALALLTLSFLGETTGYDPLVLRDALILAGCAAPSALVALPYWGKRVGDRAARTLAEVTVVDEVTCLIVLGLIAALFRPSAVGAWLLPGSAWLLIALGLGGVMGALTYLLIRGARSAAEETAMLIGCIALSAGAAGQLRLPGIVVCAVAGALLANLPLRDPRGLHRRLAQLERPLFLIFLLVAGAYWQPGDLRGWLLAPVFIGARLLGKVAAAVVSARIGPRTLPPWREITYALLPQSPMAVVVIVAAMTMYRTTSTRLGWCATAVIAGSLAELVVRAVSRTSMPVDELPSDVQDVPASSDSSGLIVVEPPGEGQR